MLAVSPRFHSVCEARLNTFTSSADIMIGFIKRAKTKLYHFEKYKDDFFFFNKRNQIFKMLNVV